MYVPWVFLRKYSYRMHQPNYLKIVDPPYCRSDLTREVVGDTNLDQMMLCRESSILKALKKLSHKKFATRQETNKWSTSSPLFLLFMHHEGLRLQLQTSLLKLTSSGDFMLTIVFEQAVICSLGNNYDRKIKRKGGQLICPSLIY